MFNLSTQSSHAFTCWKKISQVCEVSSPWLQLNGGGSKCRPVIVNFKVTLSLIMVSSAFPLNRLRPSYFYHRLLSDRITLAPPPSLLLPVRARLKVLMQL